MIATEDDTVEARLSVNRTSVPNCRHQAIDSNMCSTKQRRQTRTVLSCGLLLVAIVGLARLQFSSTSDNQKSSHTLLMPLVEASAQMPILSSIYLQTSSNSDSSSLSQATPIDQTHIKRDLSSRDPLQSHKSNESVCQVNDGESVAIVEIVESRGSDTSQWTSPSVLPISGSVELGQIELKIESETHKYFKIENKSLKLTRPLDRDAILRENSTQIEQQAISSIYLQISCVDKRRSQSAGVDSARRAQQQRKSIIPVLVKVLDLNDNAPKFSKPIYTVQVDELAPVGTVVLDQIQAIDLDSAANGQIEYRLLGSSSADYGQPAVSKSDQTTPARLVARVAPALSQLVASSTVASSAAPATTTAISSAATTAASIAPPVTVIMATTSNGQASHAPSWSSSSQQTATTSTWQSGATSAPSTGTAALEQEDYATRRVKNEPTINLNNEPIVNGPMDESEEDESDEDMLATMDATANSSSNNNHGQYASTNATGSRQGGASSPLPIASEQGAEEDTTLFVSRRQQTETTSSNGGAQQQQQQQLSRRKRRSQSFAPSHKHDQSSLPWTNLLATGNAAQQASLAAEQAVTKAASDEFDSSEYFSLDVLPQTGRPVIRLKKSLDYETRRLHTLKVMAIDRAKSGERLSSVATVLVRVLDGDDQAPVFVLDQQGCATSVLPQTSTPSSFSAEGSSSTTAAAAAATAATTTMMMMTNKRRANEDDDSSGSSADEHVSEFWDTLGLDDNPLDIGAPSSRTRLPPRARPIGSTINQRVPYARFDYQCLPSASIAAQQKQQAEYFATVMSGDSDYVLRVAPQSVRARDRDELNAPIRYSFINGTPANYSNYFQINPLDASIKQVQPVEQSQVNEFQLWIQAQEVSQQKLASLAKLTVTVLASDKSPPVLLPNSYAGQIEENSPIGARIKVAGDPKSALRIKVIDSDNDKQQQQQQQRAQESGDEQRIFANYEFKTTSDLFRVDSDGFVLVNKAALDRDEPGQTVHMFQVTARQAGLVSARSISSPISLNVTLVDENDNPPVLINSTLAPVRMAANSRGGSQVLTQIRATDLDELGENSRMRFVLHHVSNNGADRFRIDEDTGKLEALGKFFAGEQFSVTVRVIDELQRQAQGIIEVLVVPGANTGGPQFVIDGNERDNSRGYSIEVNEAVPVHSVVLQVRAIDPENDSITYSLVAVPQDSAATGQPDFGINSNTGVLSVLNKLDREEISSYKLLVQARDSGGLTTTRPIHIQITDSNDNNPVFDQASYVFNVSENVSSVVIGQVSASDNDAAENGRISYSLVELDERDSLSSRDDGTGKLFDINEQTGAIELRKQARLDYEQQRVHHLLVIARDHGEMPRSSSVSVQVQVVDAQDEVPYFERAHFETELEENLAAGQRIVQVMARDPDSVAQISYIMLAGDSGLFTVDSQTGTVSTLAGLDCEQASAHTILIGTNESLSSVRFDLVAASNALNEAISQRITNELTTARWPIARVDVHVRDVNDNAPQFVWHSQQDLLPVRVQDSAQLGDHVMQLRAHDRDLSVPNNQIRFELVKKDSGTQANLLYSNPEPTNDRCARLFLVDPSTGLVSIGSDLKREPQLSECQLVVRAHDLPANERAQLGSLATVTVFIDHLADNSPETMIGFGDSSFTIEIQENAQADSLVKMIPVINKPKNGPTYPVSCEIISGNELGRFYVRTNEQFDCELRTRDSGLDYEKQQRYALIIKLNTIGSNSRLHLAQIQVNVIDRNDNGPIFVPNTRYSHLTQQRFLAAIAIESPSETQVIQLRASDADLSHPNNLISYELLNTDSVDKQQELVSAQSAGDPMSEKFKIDPVDGIVRTAQSVEDIPSSRLPLRLRVLARDNPHEASTALESWTEVVINLIDDRHRVALVLKDTPASRVIEKREQLLGAVQERTGLIPGLERIESLKIQRNSSMIETDVAGTDVWLYLIEPGTLRIVTSDDSRVKTTLFDHRAQLSLADVLSQNLGFSRAKVRVPFALADGEGSRGFAGQGTRAGSAFVLSSILRGRTANDRLAPMLLIIALFIAIFTVIVVIYQCGSLAGSISTSTVHSNVGNKHCNGSFQPMHYGSMPHSNKLDQFFLSDLYHQSSPPPTSSSQFGTSEKMAAEQRAQMNFSSNDEYDACHQNHGLRRATNSTTYAGAQPISATASKEYETQMLKMAVLFDDNQSYDEQNCRDQTTVNPNLLP